MSAEDRIDDRIDMKFENFFKTYRDENLKTLYLKIVCSGSFIPISINDINLNQENFSFETLKDTIFPDEFSDFIITMIMWCSVPSPIVISTKSFKSEQISTIKEKYIIVEKALFNDAYVKAYTDYLGNCKTTSCSSFPSLNRDYLISILEQTSYLVPLLTKIDSQNSYKVLATFHNLCEKYNYELFKQIYPCIILIWINFYPFNDKVNINTYYKQSDKLLLSLILPPRTGKSEDASRKMPVRLSSMIKNKLPRYIKNCSSEIIADTDSVDYSNRDFTEIDAFDFDGWDPDSDEIDSDEQYEDDSDKEESWYINNPTLESFISNDTDLNIDEKEPSTFCKKLILYSNYLKTHPEEKSYVTLSNIFIFRDLFKMNIFNEKYSSYQANKSLSLSYINRCTKWVDLAMLADGLNKKALKICGIESCIAINKVYSPYFAANNEMLCNKKLEAIWEMDAREHFLSSEFIDKINLMINMLQSSLQILFQNKSTYTFLTANEPCQYDELFDKLFAEENLSKITHPLIVELAYEYYKTNNLTWMDEI